MATKICKIEYNNVTSHGCDKQECNVDCVEREGAAYGHCVPAGIIISFCFCYYKCWAIYFFIKQFSTPLEKPIIVLYHYVFIIGWLNEMEPEKLMGC